VVGIVEADGEELVGLRDRCEQANIREREPLPRLPRSSRCGDDIGRDELDDVVTVDPADADLAVRLEASDAHQ
jgi:hypothetical protein